MNTLRLLLERLGGATGSSDGNARDVHCGLVRRSTLVLVLLYGVGSNAWVIAVQRLVAGLLLIAPASAQRKEGWWLLAACSAAGVFIQWDTADNHKYLLAYWLAACAIAASVRDTAAQLRWVSKALLVCVFALATAWKLWWGEYIDGSFWYWTLIMDPRVSGIAAALAGDSSQTVETIALRIRTTGLSGESGASTGMPVEPTLINVALAMSWATLVIEAAIASLYCAKCRSLYRVSQTALVVFLIVTYVLLPVPGFASTLAVLGLSSCHDDDAIGRGMFVASFVWVQLTYFPWRSVAFGM